MSTKGRLGSDPVLKLFWSYAIPSVLGMLALTSATIIDGLFIGRYAGGQGLAAVNLSLPLMSLAFSFALMVGSGGAALAGAAMGAGRIREAREIFSLVFYVMLLGALGMTLLGMLKMDTLVRILGSDDEIAPLVVRYLSIILIFYVPFLMTYLLDIFIRIDGRPIYALTALLVSAVANIVLDALFIGVLGWGLAGAAWGTGLAQLFGVAIQLFHFIKRRSHFTLVSPRGAMSHLGKVFTNGSSELINELSVGISTFLFNWVLMHRVGALGVAAYSIVGYLSMIGMMILFGISQAVQPLISYNFGSNQVDRVRAFRAIGLRSASVVGLLFTVLLAGASKFLVGLFAGDNPELIGLSVEFARWYSPAFLLAGWNIISSGYFTSLQRALASASISLVRSLIGIAVCIVLLPHFFGIRGVFMVVPISETITALLVLGLRRRLPLSRLMPLSARDGI